ncbi:MAG: AI-2E family transporter [Verrucomicrobiales bacterium]|nr:AI-2E family transporter [Verrucomicrobiales bacterium]MCP5557037.1 AI-2E family transporter [Verrucomicrobiaceae bacterium]
MTGYKEREPDDTTPKGDRQQGFRLLLTGACLVVVLAGMKAAEGFFIPLVLAFFLSILNYPIMRWLRSYGVPNFLGMLLVVTINVGVLGLVINAGSSLLVRFQGDIPDYVRQLKSSVDQGALWLEEQGVKGAVDQVNQALNWQELTQYSANSNFVQGLASVMGSTVGTVASLVSSLTLVLILMVFILMEGAGTMSRFMAIHLAGGPNFSGLANSASDIQKYLGIKTAISAATGLLATLWCMIFDLPYPVLWGLVAFVFNFIPAVGSIVAALPPVLVALIQSGPGSAVGVMIGYLAINFSLGNFLEPTLLGRRFGVSSLVIVLSVLFWGWLWGIVGMFLAVPLTMLLKMMLDHSEEFRWLSVAMSKKKVRGREVELADFDLDTEEGEFIGSGATTEIPGRDS